MFVEHSKINHSFHSSYDDGLKTRLKIVSNHHTILTIRRSYRIESWKRDEGTTKRLKKKYIYICIRKIHLDLSRVETILLRFVITSTGGWKRVTARRGRLLSLSLDPTSKKTVSSSRLITVLASKQPALLRDFKGCTGPWWRSNRESLHRREGTENRAQREREGRDERVPRQQLRVRFHQLTYSTLYWMATPNSKRHPHPPNHTCFVYFRVIQLRPRDSSTSTSYVISTRLSIHISIAYFSFFRRCSTRV